MPADNPMTAEKVALGRQLFFDSALSADGTTSCATCHDPTKAFTDGRAVAQGVHAAEGTRNSPTLVNARFSRSLFWDGRANSLEDQVLQPLTNPKEMGLTDEDIVTRTGLPTADVAAALATYVRTIRSDNAKFDRFRRGDVDALSADERAGFEIFSGRGRCITCHGGPDLTDDRFHNTGVGVTNGTVTDVGRYAVTGNERDRGAFKTPTLREVALTAPYMHDGSLATLEDVVDFYARGGIRNTNLDPRMRRIRLNAEERRQLVAFMKALTGRITEGVVGGRN